MNTFPWLVRREYWEHRGGFLWAPVWTCTVMLALSVMGIVTAEVMGQHVGVHVNFGVPLDKILHSMNAGDVAQLGQGLDAAVLGFGVITGIVLFFVLFFYLLGALYDDRRDRSILFWKSLPISDSATVLSKMATAAVLAPVISVVVAALAGFALLIILSVWALLHGGNPYTLIWGPAEPLSVIVRMIVIIPLNALWALPTIGWLLFWSAAVRSKPFLWAVLIPILFGVLNGWVGLLGVSNIRSAFYWHHIAGRLLFSIAPGSWIFPASGQMWQHGLNQDTVLLALSWSGIAHAFAMPSLWIGAAVGAALIGAAIWFRRWRDEA